MGALALELHAAGVGTLWGGGGCLLGRRTTVVMRMAAVATVSAATTDPPTAQQRVRDAHVTPNRSGTRALVLPTTPAAGAQQT